MQSLIHALAKPVSAEELASPAIVFAPHPDDETLGCGGTIIQKRKAGANVRVVFMTDGSASHRTFVQAEQLKAMRHYEAIAACGVLGVTNEHVSFLDFEDGQLRLFREQAIGCVAELISLGAYSHVFIPYAGDTTPDHRATRDIVLAALAGIGKSVVVYEYPVWFWRHWPWAPGPVGCRRELAREVTSALLSSVRMLRHLRWAVSIEDVLEHKRAALREHRSQTIRLMSGTHPWPILSDVSDGEFLDCFFQNNEFFYRHTSKNNSQCSY